VNIDRRALGLVLLILISALSAWLERRPPRWISTDPILEPFGLARESNRVALLDSILNPPRPASRPPVIIDPNRASREEWIALPGIGPATADRIEAWLQTGRQFRRAEDLGLVRGIGPVRIEQLRPWVEFPVAPEDSSKIRGAAG
jgi:hypothetical protein